MSMDTHFKSASFKRFIFLFGIVSIVLGLNSCVLFKKKCPLPSCEIRKMHRHLLIFKNLDSDWEKKRKEKKKQKEEAKLAKDSASVANDTSSLETEHTPTYVEVDGLILDEEGNEYVSEKQAQKIARAQQKAARKAAREEKKLERKRKKGKLSEEDIVGTSDEEENKYDGLSEEEYKEKKLEEANFDEEKDTTQVSYDEKQLAKQLKKEDRQRKKEARKEERKARRGKKGESDFTKLYRSRVTKWWRRDQRPKTGKYWKKKNGASRVGRRSLPYFLHVDNYPRKMSEKEH